MAQSKTQSSHSIVSLILSIILLIVGIALLANPVDGMEVIVLILGIVLIIYGGFTIISNAARGIKGIGTYVMPLVLLALGILLIVFRGPTASILLPLIIGVWAVVQGAIHLTQALQVRRDGGYWQAKLILAVITLALGVIILISMFVGGNAVGAILGIIMIAFAVISMIQWFMGRSIESSLNKSSDDSQVNKA